MNKALISIFFSLFLVFFSVAELSGISHQKQASTTIKNGEFSSKHPKKVKALILKRVLKSSLKKQIEKQERVEDGFAVAGLLISLVCLVFPFFITMPIILGFLGGSIGTIFSIIGLQRIRDNPEKKRGKVSAIVGLVLGIICVVFYGYLLFTLVF